MNLIHGSQRYPGVKVTEGRKEEQSYGGAELVLSRHCLRLELAYPRVSAQGVFMLMQNPSTLAWLTQLDLN